MQSSRVRCWLAGVL